MENNLTPDQIKAGYSTIPGNFDPLTGQAKTASTPTGLSSLATPPAQNTNANVPNGTPPSTGTPTTPGQGLPDSSFLSLLNNMNQGFQTNNQYVTQKNAVMNALLGSPVDPTQLSTLPQNIQQIIQGGDKNQLLMQAKVLNEQISGYGKGVASSLQYLTQGYQNAQQEADKQKEDSLTAIKELYAETGDPTALQNYIKTNYPSVDTKTVNNIVNQVVSSVGIGDAIKAQEGGQYTTVNPDSGALGKYQIMPINIGNVINPTTGKPLDGKNPQDVQLFLNTPALQDQAYQKIISDLSTKYNNDPAKIAAAYYGGAGGVAKLGTTAADVKQGNYPSINDYVKQVISKLPASTSSDISDTTPSSPIYANKKQQQSLEQQFRGILAKEFSSRSGTYGLNDSKVSQANKIAAIFNQAYDSKTGNYNLNSSQYGELAEGLASLVSGSSSGASDSDVALLRTATAKGDWNKIFTYVTGEPANGSTQAIINSLAASVDREAKQAESDRAIDEQKLIGLAPTDLDPKRIQQLIKSQSIPFIGIDGVSKTSTSDSLGSSGSYQDYLKAIGE